MKKLFDYIVANVDDAELYKKVDDVLTVEIKQGQVQSVNGSKVIGISLRMNKDGKPGTAVSTSEEDFSIVDRAVISSQYRTGDKFEFLHETAEDVACYDSELADMTSAEVIEFADKLNKRIKAVAGDITYAIGLERVVSEVSMMNTAGLNDTYKKTILDVSFASMSEAGFMQNVYSKQHTSLFELSDDVLKTFIERHKISNTTYEIETKRMPVVFSGKAMGALMTRLLAGINGEMISKGVSPLESKLGQMIASPILNITDEGNLGDGFAAMKFDDEGMPTKKTSVIEKGQLKNFLISVGTSKKLDGPITGNAQKKTMFSKEVEDQPAIDSTNFMIHPGEFTDEEIIRGIDYGIYVDSVMGTHTGNIPAGEYSLNVGIGYLIKDGKLAGKVVDSMVSGNIYEDLHKIKAIGKELELMQVVFYPMGYSPMVRFDDINVVGTK